MSETMIRACVMGHPVAHSRSPMLHGHWLQDRLAFDGAYEPADVARGGFPRLPARPEGARLSSGGNITVPHKEAAFRTVDRRDEAAAAIGAVNTVWYEDDRLIGGNTDAYGFLAHLDATLPGWDRATRRSRRARRRRRGARRSSMRCSRAGSRLPWSIGRLRAPQDLGDAFRAALSAHGWDELPGLLRGRRSSGQRDLARHEREGAARHRPRAAANDAIVYDIVYVPLETALLREARAARPSHGRRPRHAAAPGGARASPAGSA